MPTLSFTGFIWFTKLSLAKIMQNTLPKDTVKIFLPFLIFLIFCNNLLWMRTLPYNMASDEGDHYTICRFISREGRPPVFVRDLPSYWMNFFTKFPATKEEIEFYNSLPERQH